MHQETARKGRLLVAMHGNRGSVPLSGHALDHFGGNARNHLTNLLRAVCGLLDDGRRHAFHACDRRLRRRLGTGLGRDLTHNLSLGPGHTGSGCHFLPIFRNCRLAG
ncbi:MAG: hypothetical protein NVS4B3_24630 [Gemmatimonadaceae bacterium]